MSVSGSLSSCDQFISVFHSRGLRPDAVCPCAASPEGLTVAVRRLITLISYYTINAYN